MQFFSKKKYVKLVFHRRANLDSDYKKNAKEFIDIIKDEFKITLNCGIGTGKTARDAVKLATKSLDTIRDIRDSGKEKPEIYELA